jgi:uncharacterized protein
MKEVLRRACLLLVLPATMAAAGQQPKIDLAKEADIRQLLQVTGMTAMVEKQMGQMADQVKPLLERSLPPGERRQEIVEAFTKKFLARAKSEDLIEQVIPVYAKYLTDDDVRDVIRFYGSPVGQRLLKVMPEMMKESGDVGQRWGEQVAREVLQEMAQEYPELRQQP